MKISLNPPTTTGTGTREVGALGHREVDICWFKLGEAGTSPGYSARDVETKLLGKGF